MDPADICRWVFPATASKNPPSRHSVALSRTLRRAVRASSPFLSQQEIDTIVQQTIDRFDTFLGTLAANMADSAQEGGSGGVRMEYEDVLKAAELDGLR